MTTAPVSSEALPIHTELLVNGQSRAAADGATFTLLNPATGMLIAEVASAGEADVDEAVCAARRQFEEGEWSRLSGAERGRLLYRLADLMERDQELLARLEALDVGRPLFEPRMEMGNAIDTVRYFAGWADKIEGRTIPTSGAFGRPTLSYTLREPVGVAALITSWNTPTMIATWKFAPALAAGCTVVLKPAELAPLSTMHLGRLAQEAGFPDGVFNVLPGAGRRAGAALVQHPGVDKVSFTGSPQVGRDIMRAAAQDMKRITLELGGKSPQIILEDADVPSAVFGCAMGVFSNQGQICAAGSRILVHRSLYDTVVEGLAQTARQVRIGDPFDPQTTMGSLVSAAQRDRVLGYIEAGRREGARVAAGGEMPDGAGFFVQPTVFADASNNMTIAREEIFGPVATVIPFEDVNEAVRLANDSQYGLAATLWTRDVGGVHLIAPRLRVGAVWVNGWGLIDPRLPWGGVRASGTGKENGWNGIESYTEEKVVTVLL